MQVSPANNNNYFNYLRRVSSTRQKDLSMQSLLNCDQFWIIERDDLQCKINFTNEVGATDSGVLVILTRQSTCLWHRSQRHHKAGEEKRFYSYRVDQQNRRHPVSSKIFSQLLGQNAWNLLDSCCIIFWMQSFKFFFRIPNYSCGT